MDEFIEELIYNEVVFEVTLPVIPKRRILEVNEDLKPRVSILEADLSFDSEEEINRKIQGKNIDDEISEKKDMSDDYADINLDKYYNRGEESQSSASDYESESEKSSDTNRKRKITSKKKDENYLNKKRYNEDSKKGKEISKESKNFTESEVKVDENSVEYWMNLRKKLGIK